MAHTKETPQVFTVINFITGNWHTVGTFTECQHYVFSHMDLPLEIVEGDKA